MSVTHRIKSKQNGKTKLVELTHKKAIMLFCKECVGFVTSEISQCTSKLCPLYPFRTGRNATTHSPLSSEEAQIYL